jgi:hypothetical protein
MNFVLFLFILLLRDGHLLEGLRHQSFFYTLLYIMIFLLKSTCHSRFQIFWVCNFNTNLHNEKNSILWCVFTLIIKNNLVFVQPAIKMHVFSTCIKGHSNNPWHLYFNFLTPLRVTFCVFAHLFLRFLGFGLWNE